MPFPARPTENQDPWYATRETYDDAIEAAIEAEHDSDGVHNLDAIPDGTTKKLMTATERTKLAGIEDAADVTDAGNVGSSIHGATGKTTPVDADTVPLIDSAASNVLKKVTWANVKATLKTYFDTLYAAVSHTHAASDITSGTVGTARLGSGTANSGTYLRGDQTWAAVSGGDGGLMPESYLVGSYMIHTSTHGFGNGSATTRLMVANRIHWIPIYLPTSITPDEISLEVTTGSASGVARVGMFSHNPSTGGMTLIEDYGSVGTVATGIKTLTPGTGTAVGPGWAWLAFFADQDVTVRATTARRSLGSNGITAIDRVYHYLDTTYAAFSSSYTVNGTPLTAGATVIAIGISD